MVTAKIWSLLLWAVLLKEFRKLLPQRFDFRAVANLNVRIVGIVIRVVLVISFRAIEPLQRCYLGHNRLRKHLRMVELGDVCLREALLILIRIEDGRAVGRSNVRS